MSNQQISFDQFNKQQKHAVAMAIEWFKGWLERRHQRQYFFLAGFAGTGKTTVASYIADQCARLYAEHKRIPMGDDFVHRNIATIAPTGKAASRLRFKGFRNTKTMHQFIYNVRGEDEDGDPIFVGKGALDEKPALVICDEGSMIGEWDANNLLSHGLPILFLGDTGQLRPVKAAQFLIKGREDVLLEDIERNAGNIVRASMFVRQGKRLPPREYDDVRVRLGGVTDEELLEHAGEDGVILCTFNSTRIEMNKRIRKLLGFKGQIPMIGEKVVCMFNQHAHRIMNGEQGIVLGYREIPDEEKDDGDIGCLMIEFKCLTTGKRKSAKFNPRSFDNDPEVRKEIMKTAGAWDYGNCLTIHKSQGSEWPKVLVIEEMMSGVPYAELMYTGITRAQDQLTVRRAN
jgi:exodeoxyribonuclease-5